MGSAAMMGVQGTAACGQPILVEGTLGHGMVLTVVSSNCGIQRMYTHDMPAVQELVARLKALCMKLGGTLRLQCEPRWLEAQLGVRLRGPPRVKRWRPHGAAVARPRGMQQGNVSCWQCGAACASLCIGGLKMSCARALLVCSRLDHRTPCPTTLGSRCAKPTHNTSSTCCTGRGGTGRLAFLSHHAPAARDLPKSSQPVLCECALMLWRSGALASQVPCPAHLAALAEPTHQRQACGRPAQQGRTEAAAVPSVLLGCTWRRMCGRVLPSKTGGEACAQHSRVAHTCTPPPPPPNTHTSLQAAGKLAEALEVAQFQPQSGVAIDLGGLCGA